MVCSVASDGLKLLKWHICAAFWCTFIRDFMVSESFCHGTYSQIPYRSSTQILLELLIKLVVSIQWTFQYPILRKGVSRKLNQTLRITHFWPPCGVRNSNNNSNLSQHHTCRCPSAFVAGTSAGIMLTIWDLQRVETDWTFSGLVQFPKNPLSV